LTSTSQYVGLYVGSHFVPGIWEWLGVQMAQIVAVIRAWPIPPKYFLRYERDLT